MQIRHQPFERALLVRTDRRALRILRGVDHCLRITTIVFFRQWREGASLLPQYSRMAIAEDRQQPGFRVGTAQTIEAAIRAQHGVLHDIVSIRRRPREPSSKARGRIEMRQHLLLEATTPLIHALARTRR